MKTNNTVKLAMGGRVLSKVIIYFNSFRVLLNG